VWNEPNGDVGAIASGSQEKINAFIEWCKEGPPLAHVIDVKVEIMESPETYNSFEISRNNHFNFKGH
jgi:acylphosphatase